MLHFLQLVLLSSFLIAAGPVSAASLSYPKNFDSKYWQKILHYKNGKSQVDGEKFFLAPDGKTNPEAELMWTIEAFREIDSKVGWFNYPAQCVFRERYEFLKSQGLLAGVPESPCPMFDEWKAGLNAESVTLIFSSSYPNNPSSLFGHTLLRLNQKGKTNDLLDYAVAFSAVPETEDMGIVFAAKGMFGGYKGLFEVTKYYTKVNEYNNGESRDLIEYNLKMSPEELNRMINHLWELYQTTYFDYFFTDENCSAVLADLLAVAYKDDDRVNAHARWYYLPGEMVKHFSGLEGRIVSTHYRPSLKKKLAKMWEGLSPEEISQVKAIVDKEELPLEMNNPKVLEAVASYLDFTHYRTKKKLSEKSQKLMRSALIARAKLPKGEVLKESFDQNNMPEHSHDPQKISFFTRVENRNTLLGFELKQGYHDLMARDVGFDAFSQFEFLYGSLLYDLKKKKLDYDELVLVDLISLHEYRFYDPQLSWKAKVASERIYDLDCSLCHKINVKALGGVTFRTDKTVLSFMGGVFGEVSPHFKKGFRMGPLMDASFYAQLGSQYKVGLFNEIRFDATKKISDEYYNKMGLKHSFFPDKKQDFRLESSVISRFGSFSKNAIVHEVSYGRYF